MSKFHVSNDEARYDIEFTSDGRVAVYLDDKYIGSCSWTDPGGFFGMPAAVPLEVIAGLATEIRSAPPTMASRLEDDAWSPQAKSKIAVGIVRRTALDVIGGRCNTYTDREISAAAAYIEDHTALIR